MAGGQRQHDRVLAGSGLQFEVERAAEAFAQGQAPGAIEAAAKGRMNDQLGAAGFIEKTFHHQRVLRGQGTQGLAGAGQVIDQLLGAVGAKAEVAAQPIDDGLRLAIAGTQLFIDSCLQASHRQRQFIATARRLAQPERDVRQLALGVLDADPAAFDADDAVGAVTELEDIAGQALDGEIFVDAADVQALGFEDHGVVGVVRNGAAAGNGCQLAASAPAQRTGHGIAVQVSAAHALAAVVAFGQYPQQGLVMAVIEAGVRRGSTKLFEQGLLMPFLAADLGNDLLGQHVQRRHRNVQGIELATAHAVEQGGAFDQVVAGSGK
ncbi:hypothetical protein D9M71_245400 [compost metagenome]